MAVATPMIERFLMERLDADGVTVLRLNGDFDRKAAGAVRAAIEELPPGEVVLDFSRTRNFCDLVVPMLTRGLESRSIRVSGLPRHQERVFQYFGWPAEQPPAKTYYVAEDSFDS